MCYKDSRHSDRRCRRLEVPGCDGDKVGKQIAVHPPQSQRVGRTVQQAAKTDSLRINGYSLERVLQRGIDELYVRSKRTVDPVPGVVSGVECENHDTELFRQRKQVTKRVCTSATTVQPHQQRHRRVRFRNSWNIEHAITPDHRAVYKTQAAKTKCMLSRLKRSRRCSRRAFTRVTSGPVGTQSHTITLNTMTMHALVINCGETALELFFEVQL